jgi:hypothetical protein
VPEEVSFATRGELTRKKLERTFEANIPAGWVTGGETYGTNGRLRRCLEARGCSYVLAEGHSSKLPREADTLLPPTSEWVRFSSVGGAEDAYE